MNVKKSTAKKTTVTPTKKSPGNRYSIETWAIIEGLYESGRFTSIEKLYQSCIKNIANCPTLPAIRKRFAKQNKNNPGTINKNKTLEEKKEEVRKGWAELFDDLGLPDSEVAKIIVDGCKAGEDVKGKIVDYITRGDSILDPAFQNLIADLFQNLKVRSLFIKERNRLTNSYPAEEHKVSGSIGVKKTREGEMSDDEIKAELARIARDKGNGT